MNNIKLTNIRCHGVLAQHLQKSEYNLAISSVGEAVRAIEVLSSHKLYKFLVDGDKKGIKYRVLVDGRDFLTEEAVTLEKPETIFKSELCLRNENIKTIDFVPVLEGAKGSGKDFIAIVVGVILIVVGIVLSEFGIGVALIVAGIGLVAAGVINLLSAPPKFDDFRDFGRGGKSSYLFNGPQNTTNEGGPVAIGYGELLIGSQVVSASYRISYISIWEDSGREIARQYAAGEGRQSFEARFPMPYFYTERITNDPAIEGKGNKVFYWSFYPVDADPVAHTRTNVHICPALVNIRDFNPVPIDYFPTNMPPP